jgi:hypothetical protein
VLMVWRPTDGASRSALAILAAIVGGP